MKLEPKHWALIAAFLTGTATQLITAQHGWADVASPGFVAGLMIQIAAAITAIFVGAPGASAALDQANKNTDMANDSVRAALNAPPLDAGKIDPKRFIGTGAFLLACLLAGSACSVSLKQKAVAGLQVTETALELSHDAERRLCSPTSDQAKGIKHCDGAQAHAIGLTDAVHLKAAAFYSQAFDLQMKAAAAARRWRVGDPVPSDVVSYRLALNAVLDELKSVVPNESMVLAKLQEAIGQAADVARLAGVK